MDTVMTFPKWLESKFVEWQHSQGERKNIADFANYLGVSQAVVSFWMNGARKPNIVSVQMLARALGIEVYDALGLPRPEENLLYIQSNWEQLSARERKAIRDMAEKYVTSNNKKG